MDANETRERRFRKHAGTPPLRCYIAIDALKKTPTVRLYAANLDEAERRFAEQLVPSTAENLTRFGHRSCRSIRWDDAGERHHVYITIDPEVTL